MKLYYAPISTYSQKALIALYEKGIEFEREIVNLLDESKRAEYKEVYPIGKVPLLKPSDDHMIPESTIIIEYLENHFDQGTKLIPDNADEARQVRFMDRMNDFYLNDAVVTILFSDNRTEAQVEQAKHNLNITYNYLNSRLENNTWVVGDNFTMADCSCIPPLFYAQKAHPFSEYPNIVAYFNRAKERTSYKHVLEEELPILKQMNM